MDAERLFFISMGATWLILFYHVFLTVGGYKHFLKTMHDDDVDMKMDYYPFVSVLVPAHNEEDLADAVGIGHHTHITGIHKMIHYFFTVCHKLHLLSYFW